MSAGAVDGRQLRQQWDATCHRVAAVVAAAAEHARQAGVPHVETYLRAQVAAIRGLRALADGRRAIPGSVGSGLLHDIPPELAEPPYGEAKAELDRLREIWDHGLGSDWDWAHGFPPGWPTSMADRLRAGIFYRRQ